jgi:hypothetical protein
MMLLATTDQDRWLSTTEPGLQVCSLFTDRKNPMFFGKMSDFFISEI